MPCCSHVCLTTTPHCKSCIVWRTSPDDAQVAGCHAVAVRMHPLACVPLQCCHKPIPACCQAERGPVCQAAAPCPPLVHMGQRGLHLPQRAHPRREALLEGAGGQGRILLPLLSCLVCALAEKQGIQCHLRSSTAEMCHAPLYRLVVSTACGCLWTEAKLIQRKRGMYERSMIWCGVPYLQLCA